MRLPKLTLLVCALASVIFILPDVKDIMIYDREAIVNGQWWRLITGNLVHLSTAQFTFDVLALLIISMVGELRGVRYLWVVYMTAGAAVGGTILIASPELRFYGGLSGIVTALLVFLCLRECLESGMQRVFAISLLALIAGKIGMEFMFGQSLLSTVESQPFILSPVSHLAGAVSGCVCMLFRLDSKMPNEHSLPVLENNH